MDRLFPGLTPESHEQATLSAYVGGLGWRRASEIALSANLGVIVMATPKIHSMAEAMVRAGLLRPGQIESVLATRTRQVEDTYLATLDEL